MPDKMTPEQRSKCMSRIRGKDTKPEMTVRRWLWKRGYRYRKHEKRLPGTPDIVMRKYGIVIFIHGCFWHGHEGHLHLPQTNADFWRTKIERNKARDIRQKKELLDLGWSVLTVWECQLTPTRRERTLAAIEYFINSSFLLLKGNRPKVLFTTDDAPEIQPDVIGTPVAAEPEAAYGSNIDDE